MATRNTTTNNTSARTANNTKENTSMNNTADAFNEEIAAALEESYAEYPAQSGSTSNRRTSNRRTNKTAASTATPAPQAAQPPASEPQRTTAPARKIVSAAETRRSGSDQTPWNELLQKATSGNIQARLDLRDSIDARHASAYDLTKRYTQSPAIAQASLRLMKLKYYWRNLDINSQKWNNLISLVDHRVWENAVMARLSDIDVVAMLSGQRQGEGERNKRGIAAMEYSVYGTLEETPTGYGLTFKGRTIAIPAASVYDIITKHKEGTLQSVPYTNRGVMGRFDSKSTNLMLLDGDTLVFPKGETFIDANGVVRHFDRDVRISMPYKTLLWNYWPVAAVKDEYEPNTTEATTIDLQVLALKKCFTLLNNGVLQPQNKEQLIWVHAVYCYFKNGKSLFEKGGMLAGMNEEILYDLKRFTDAWRELEMARAEANATTNQREEQVARYVPIDGNAGVVAADQYEDYDPLAEVEL